MTEVGAWYGSQEVRLALPESIQIRTVTRAPVPAAADPGGVVAAALDAPIGAPPLSEAARGARHVAIVVPDRTRPASTADTLLPVLARLARARLGPSQIRVVVARGIHAAAPRDEITRLVGADVMSALRPVQSAPDTPELNETIGEHPTIGAVRVHRQVATADLVVLTGSVAPHHLAGFGGGPKALVPGVAERKTVVAAHRLTLDALVRPDGSIQPVTGRLEGNRFRDALLGIARDFGRTYLVNVVLGDEGGIAAAAAGEVGQAHEAAVALWRASRQIVEPVACDLVVVGARAPRDGDLIQAHKALLAAAAWARPGAPIVWLARAPNGPGHAEFLPWFEAGRLPRHLAALRERFHPYGLTAYSIRRIARDHPVHVVSTLSPDILRPMGLMPFADPARALAHALEHHDVSTCAVLPEA